MPSLTSLLHSFAHPHAPNFALLADVPPVILIHLGAALTAFVIGAIQIFGPKGTGLHRVLGWIWIIFMVVVAGTSLFIRIINHGSFSFIHIFSIATLISAPLIVYAARKHQVDLHKRRAITLYVGALLIAGLFTLFPGRLMWAIFFG